MATLRTSLWEKAMHLLVGRLSYGFLWVSRFFTLFQNFATEFHQNIELEHLKKRDSHNSAFPQHLLEECSSTRGPDNARVAEGRVRVRRSAKLGTKDCTPEIDTSEIIVDFQWHFPMDVQWHFQMDVHLFMISVV